MYLSIFSFKNTGLAGKAGIALLAAALIYQVCFSWVLYSAVPMGDPAAFPGMARASRYFYDSGIREPVLIALTKAALALGAGDQASARLVTAVAFTASGLLLAFFAGRVYGLAAGLAAALLFAVNPYAGFYSVQGVSNLTSGLFLMIFCFGLAGKGISGGNAALLGAAGGLCMLCRLENILVVLLALCVSFSLDSSKRRAKFCAGIFAAALFLTLPYMAYQYRQFGHPLYSQTMAARFWENTEKNGPLCADRYSGGPMSLGSFVLRKGPAASAWNLLKSYAKEFSYYLPRLLYHKALAAAFFAGIFFLFRRKDWFALLLLPILLLPVSLFSSIDQATAGGGIELRFFLNALWLMCVYCGLGISGAVSLIMNGGCPE